MKKYKIKASFYLKVICLLSVFTACNKEGEVYDLKISNASIVNVANGTISEHKLILVKDNRIAAIKEAKNESDFKAKHQVDAQNKFVMPGLWDMHVHFRGGDSLVEENKELLNLFLAYGVTTIRDAGGDITPALLDWRKQISKGELAGPRIFTSGPKLDGANPSWPGSIAVTNQAEIEAALDSLQDLGVDYVKMYDGSLTPENYYAIIQEAEERGLKTTGHMPLQADFLKAVNFGLDGAEHMYYPLKACSPKADSLSELNIGYGMMDEIIETYDPALADEVFSELSRENVYITPTLYIGKTLAQILEVDHTRDTLLPYIGDGIQETYKGRIEGAKRARDAGSTMREKMETKSAAMIRPMQDAGVKLLAGSDSGAFNSYVYPGESLINELYALVDAGLSPQEALTTSVINGPMFFDLVEDYGAIEKGKIADMLILNSNPLEDLKSLQEIFMLIKGGERYPKKRLKQLLDKPY